MMQWLQRTPVKNLKYLNNTECRQMCYKNTYNAIIHVDLINPHDDLCTSVLSKILADS